MLKKGLNLKSALKPLQISEILNGKTVKRSILLSISFWRLAQWRISEHKTFNTPQKLMRGRMFN
jgi:hypothetical protein